MYVVSYNAAHSAAALGSYSCCKSATLIIHSTGLRQFMVTVNREHVYVCLCVCDWLSLCVGSALDGQRAICPKAAGISYSFHEWIN